MAGKSGITHRKRYMKVQNNSILFVCLLLAGCSTLSEDTQKALNRDYTMTELAKISALVEIVKTSDDSQVKIQAIQALRDIQKPKEQSKYWFER